VTAPVVIQFFVGDLKMTRDWIIGVGRKLLAKPERADVGRILKPRTAAIERGIVDGQRKLTGLGFVLAHGKRVFTSERANFVAHKLNDPIVAH